MNKEDLEENVKNLDNHILQMQKKMEDFEKQGLFDEEIEDNPPAKVLMPNKVDYLNKNIIHKFQTFVYNILITKYFEDLIKKNSLVIDNPSGMENFIPLKNKGVIITCNHISIADGYIVYKLLKPYLKREKIFKVIREGNYTSFPGFYGKVFKHCNTLPLSSNKDTMKLFVKAVDTLLKKRKKILIYPEQAMWTNYKKPRPLKEGAFHFAVKNNVPVLPMFITMTETDKIGQDGFPVLKYKLNIGKPIYKNPDLTNKENIKYMANQNFEVWKEIYEKTYNKKLEYIKE